MPKKATRNESQKSLSVSTGEFYRYRPEDMDVLLLAWALLYENRDAIYWIGCLMDYEPLRKFMTGEVGKNPIVRSFAASLTAEGPEQEVEIVLDGSDGYAPCGRVAIGGGACAEVVAYATPLMNASGSWVDAHLSGKTPAQQQQWLEFHGIPTGGWEVGMCVETCTWDLYRAPFNPENPGTEAEKLCAALDLAATILHELVHVAEPETFFVGDRGEDGFDESPIHGQDECERTWRIENMFRWVMAQRYDLRETCCGDWYTKAGKARRYLWYASNGSFSLTHSRCAPEGCVECEPGARTGL